MLKHDVETRLTDLAADLRTLGIRRIGVFGSTARGDARPDSDVDLLVEFAEGRKTFDAFMDVAELLESEFPVHVDILTPNPSIPGEERESKRKRSIMKSARNLLEDILAECRFLVGERGCRHQQHSRTRQTHLRTAQVHGTQLIT